ncbi:MAG TPA: HEPN domain-containing protein [Candidatus Kapabacteria bacterium]|nr:HEPN domain-containing protein [Candidatus Kapabacteria bacterium]HPO62063.1 HEPN domain-containing protein [Candidatus Kapabacteria bacterium]
MLLENCKNFDKSFIDLDGIEILSEYAVELRYPDDFFTPSLDEAEESINLAFKVKSFVISKLNEW